MAMTASDPTATRHAQNRWIQITGDYVSDPAGYWPEGLSLEDHDHGLHAHEARYLPDQDVILIRKNSNLTTVIDNDDSLRGAAKDAIREVTTDV